MLGLAKLVKESFPEADCLMGTATAGIAHAALVADILELPMGYVITQLNIYYLVIQDSSLGSFFQAFSFSISSSLI